MQSLIEQGQRAGTFRRDMPRQWLITTTYSLMHAAAEDTAAGRLDAGDAAGLITATPARGVPPAGGRMTRPVRQKMFRTDRGACLSTGTVPFYGQRPVRLGGVPMPISALVLR